jgi:type IV pilus assembly protein PilW
MNTQLTRRPPARTQRGLSLVEIMVALVLGLFLILGAVTIYNQSRKTYRTTEAVARLQEAARYAFDVIEPDVRMASYWGLASRPEYILNKANAGEATPGDLSDAAATIDACGKNWAIDLDQYLQAWNGNAMDEDEFPLECAPFANRRAGTDVLVIRRGNEVAPATLVEGLLYLQTSRLQGTIFRYDGGCTSDDPRDPLCIPPEYSPPASETRSLISTAYYISTESTARGDVPSLRRKRLIANSVLDEEVIPGVEDLQVRLGIDTNGDTSADQYVDPEDDWTVTTSNYGGTIVSATIWLRIRAEDREVGFVDDATYEYADVDESGDPSDFRRFVISKTFQLRNKRI